MGRDGSMALAGYMCEPREGMLSTATYELTIEDGGATIRGEFESWDDDYVDFSFRRATQEEANAWRAKRQADIQFCQHEKADEVRKGNGYDLEQLDVPVAATLPANDDDGTTSTV